jgi:Amt family ammonium transporter
MTPGLGLFYGGMVGERNVLNTLMLSFVAMCLVGVQWVVCGYSFAFGKGNGAFGGINFYGAIGVGLEPYEPYGSNLPHLAFWWFQ